MADLLEPAVFVGVIYALVALGLTAVFTATHVINLAIGEQLVVGALVAFTLRVQWGLPWVVVIGLVIILSAAFGAVMERLIMLPVRLSGSKHAWILASIAVSIIVSNALTFPYGRDIQPLPPIVDGKVSLFGYRLAWQTLVGVLVAGLLLVGYALLLKRTRYGRAIRSTAFNPDVAELMGIDTRIIGLSGFVMSGVIVGLAGVVVAPVFFISTSIGLVFAIKGFIAAVIGGVGSIPGAIVGGLTVGFLDTIGRNYVPGGYGELVVLVVLGGILLMRPYGIFGHRTGEA